MNQITLIGKRKQDINGNTYHTVEIYVDGDFIAKSPITYGYEYQYEQTARNILCNKHGIVLNDCKVVSSVTDVKRRKDL